MRKKEKKKRQYCNWPILVAQNLSPDNNTSSNFKPVFPFLEIFWHFSAKKLGKFWFFLD
jgi:hypothetical protein